MFSGLSAVQPSTRRWTALASFTLQAAAVAVALVFPMLYPQNLPQAFLAHRIFLPVSSGEVQAETGRSGASSSGPTTPNVLVVSRKGVTFGKVRPIDNETGLNAPPLGAEFGTGPALDPLIGVTPTVLPYSPASRPLRRSVMMEGNLIHRVEPLYPAIAKQIHLEGTVVLQAIISREGNIERVEVASGLSPLVSAARDAVQQWKYRPYLLNDEPIEVETQITVNFVLQR